MPSIARVGMVIGVKSCYLRVSGCGEMVCFPQAVCVVGIMGAIDRPCQLCSDISFIAIALPLASDAERQLTGAENESYYSRRVSSSITTYHSCDACVRTTA